MGEATYDNRCLHLVHVRVLMCGIALLWPAQKASSRNVSSASCSYYSYLFTRATYQTIPPAMIVWPYWLQRVGVSRILRSLAEDAPSQPTGSGFRPLIPETHSGQTHPRKCASERQQAPKPHHESWEIISIVSLHSKGEGDGSLQVSGI